MFPPNTMLIWDMLRRLRHNRTGFTTLRKICFIRFDPRAWPLHHVDLPNSSHCSWGARSFGPPYRSLPLRAPQKVDSTLSEARRTEQSR